MDAYYLDYLLFYDTERVIDIKNQKAGIDVIFRQKHSKNIFFIDEKAQLDYVNEDLPTFAFELGYYINETYKEGWLYDSHKKTHFYALATAIYEDEPGVFTTCKITLVNRKKLCSYLSHLNITKQVLNDYRFSNKGLHGKLELKELCHRSEGYLYFSKNNKLEKPVNLVLKLDFLLEKGIAKRLI